LANAVHAFLISTANFISAGVSLPGFLISVVPKMSAISEPCHAPSEFGQQGPRD
jgi:hypothetical protein